MNDKLAQFSKEGKFLMLALDHRGSIRKLMNPQDPDSVTEKAVEELKHDIIMSVIDQFSGLLIDETYGLPSYADQTKPFLLPLEKTGYVEKGDERVNELGYSIDQIKQLGAKGAKLLIYFNPKAETAPTQLMTAKKMVDEAKMSNFPIFVEIVTYKRQGEEVSEEKIVIDSLKMFLESGIRPDVYKLEYPGSQESCKQITDLLGDIPWILLTKGVSFEEFRPQMESAFSGGAIGFLAGRALWQEVTKLSGEEKEDFLKNTLPERFKEISDIVLNKA